MLYEVQARVSEKRADGWTRTTDIPTFLLDGDRQGIRDAAHAERIARKVLNPTEREDLTVHVLVIPCG